MSFIEFRNAGKAYENGHTALINISFSVNRGEFVYIVGENGSGKSTLLELMTGVCTADWGEITVGGQDVSSLTSDEIPYFRRSFGIISPGVPLMPDKDVFQNVALPLYISGRPKSHIRQAVEAALGSVGMKDRMHCSVDELSGGEQIKVMIARAIIADPAILIADEPAANLSEDDAWDIFALLEHINYSGTTVIMATHQKKLVDISRKRVIRLEKGRLVSDVKRGKY